MFSFHLSSASHSVKWKLEAHWLTFEVFPWYMICIGENSPDNAKIANVSVMFLLSVKPLIGTQEQFFEAIVVILPTETYVEGVWSVFSTNSGGILCWVITRPHG